jgi:glycosyltransferase involved in cell wall biosynthesis
MRWLKPSWRRKAHAVLSLSGKQKAVMKIAQVSPVFESVPPKGYGGTERVISYLTEELVRIGHEVTLFATGDSQTAARLVPIAPHSIRATPGRPDWMAYQCISMDKLASMAEEFDLIHFHTDYLHFPLARHLPVPHVTTLHGRLDLPELPPLYQHIKDVPVVSISDSQRAPLPFANWVGTVHHGLPQDLFAATEAPGEYFAFVGRVSPEKRLDRAIDIAQRCNRLLVVAAKIDKLDEPYFEQALRPLFNKPWVRYIGEVGQDAKRELLENARALLFPIDWPEPFGLVMIEAFSCGTPVVAWSNGAIPELVDDGVTGFVVSDQDEAVRAAARIHELDRRACRATFDRRFTASRMANDYLRIYQQLIDQHRDQGRARGGRSPS